MQRTRALLSVLLAVAPLAGCAGPPDPPQSHAGTCSHFNTATHRFENVPDCLLRSRDTLINGLPPVDTNQQP